MHKTFLNFAALGFLHTTHNLERNSFVTDNNTFSAYQNRNDTNSSQPHFKADAISKNNSLTVETEVSFIIFFFQI